MSASATSGTRRPRIVATPAPPRRSSVTDSPLARTISSIAERGMAKCWLPIETVSAGMMVSVSGTRRVMRVPSAGRAVDLDDAADPLDVGADHVHADAAAGNRGDFLGGRQAGFEDQRQLLARAQLRGGGLVEDAGGDRFFDQPLAVDAAAVVLDVDQDLVARLARRDGQHADLALAGLQPLGRRLDAVIDRVADDVGQRIADHLDHFAIELDVAALDIDQHLLAELGRQVADHARQRDEQILDPLHAGAGDRVAHFGDDRRQALERAVDGTSVEVSRSRRASSLRASTMSETPLITRSSSSTDRRMVRGADVPALRFGDGRGDRRWPRLRRRARARRSGRCRRLSGKSSPLSIAATISPMRSMIASTALTSGAVGLAAAGADVGERVLGGVAQRLEPREVEKAAIAFDGVDEAEDGIEPRAVVGLGFPGDDLAAQGFEHLAAFGNEIGNQIVHRRASPQAASCRPYAQQELMRRYPCAAAELARRSQALRRPAVGQLDRPAGFRGQAVREPGAGRARLDRAVRRR